MKETRILHEITPLQDEDSLYIADRCKMMFSYPIHNHAAFELNFIEHAAGVRRLRPCAHNQPGPGARMGTEHMHE